MGSPPLRARVAENARRFPLLEPLTKVHGFYITAIVMSKVFDDFRLLAAAIHGFRKFSYAIVQFVQPFTVYS